MFSYIKRYQMEHFYDYICLNFLKKNKNDIARLEKICILMQSESLANNKKPIFYCKIYINYDNSRIEYLSDIFRVMKPARLGSHKFCSIKKMEKYHKIMKKYSKLSNEQLDIKINEINNDKSLNSRYFYKGTYGNKLMRYHARYLARSNNHLVLNIIKFILDMISSIVVIIPLGYVIIKFFNIQTESLINLFSNDFLMLVFIVLLFQITWLFIYTRPTQFEVNNKDFLMKSKDT